MENKNTNIIEPQIYTLTNGFRVVLDYIPYVKTACIAMFAGVGARIETKENNGICHFLEHMIFKGTKTRNNFQISEEIENRGGYINAWTSKEKTTWYAKVMSQDNELALEILVDIIKNSIFPIEELDKEKNVILQEIKQEQDSPEDLAYNLFSKIAYKDNAIALPILGPNENILKFSQNDLIKHLHTYYSPNNMCLVISGNFSHDIFLSKTKELLDDFIASLTVDSLKYAKPKFYQGFERIIKPDLQQNHVFYGWESYSYLDKKSYVATLFSNILGEGMSSRLFKEVREKRSLVYSINSFYSSYQDTGYLGIQAVCEQSKVQELINLFNRELEKLATSDILEIELEKAKKQTISDLFMDLESTYIRCETLAEDLLNFGKILKIEDVIQDINKVTIAKLKQFAEDSLNKGKAIAVISN